MSAPPRATPSEFRRAFEGPLVRLGVSLDALRGRWEPSSGSPTQFYRAFAQVRRPLGDLARQPLEPSGAELEALGGIYPGFEPSTWSVTTLARAWLALEIPEEHVEPWLHQLLRHAELGEQVAVYRSLYALAEPQRFAVQVAEGVRTNMVDVFDSVALHNPIAPWLLDEAGWLQLVLKAVFMARPLYRIVGLDARWTPAIASAAVDYANERWSAGRDVHPELWRLVAPSREPQAVAALERARASSDAATSRAAAWALGDRDPAHWPDSPVPDSEPEGWRRIGRDAEQRAQATPKRDVLYPSPLSKDPR